MTVLNYMAEQRRKLSEKYTGQTYLFGNGIEGVPVRPAEEILEEMNGMCGLNRGKRSIIRRRSAQTECAY